MKKTTSRRRKERAIVQFRLRGVFFSCKAISEKELRVTNITELGVGIELPERYAPINIGSVLDATLLVGYTAADLTAKVIRFQPPEVGLEFVELGKHIQTAIRYYFGAEIVGASLKLESHTPHFLSFKDDHDNLIDLWLAHKGNIKAFNFHILGSDVRWTQAGGLRLFQNEREFNVPDHMRGQLVKMMGSAEAIPEEHREFMLSVLRYLPIS